jgi:hypothetical protein
MKRKKAKRKPTKKRPTQSAEYQLGVRMVGHAASHGFDLEEGAAVVYDGSSNDTLRALAVDAHRKHSGASEEEAERHVAAHPLRATWMLLDDVSSMLTQFRAAEMIPEFIQAPPDGEVRLVIVGGTSRSITLSLGSVPVPS